MRVDPTHGFLKRFRKLKANRQERLTRALEKFVAEPLTNSLDFRRLAGAPEYFVIDVSGGDRILLRRLAEGHFEIVDFGPHDVYRRWNR